MNLIRSFFCKALELIHTLVVILILLALAVAAPVVAALWFFLLVAISVGNHFREKTCRK